MTQGLRAYDADLGTEPLGELWRLEHAGRALRCVLTTHTLERGLLWSDMVVVLTNGRVAHTGASARVTLPELRALYADAGRSGR